MRNPFRATLAGTSLFDHQTVLVASLIFMVGIFGGYVVSELQFGKELRQVRLDLDAHRALLIHPGAALSTVVEAIRAELTVVQSCGTPADGERIEVLERTLKLPSTPRAGCAEAFATLRARYQALEVAAAQPPKGTP